MRSKFLGKRGVDMLVRDALANVVAWPARALSVRSSVKSIAKLVAAGRFAEAEARLRPALQAAPKHATLLRYFAICAHSTGRHADARQRWEDLRRVRPRSDLAWSGVCSNAREMGDLAYADEVMRQALRLFPTSTRVRSEAARLCDAKDSLEEAAAHWRWLADRRPPSVDWMAHYARDLIKLDRLDEARATIETGLRHGPTHTNMLQTQGLLAVAEQDWPRALALWDDLLRKSPEDEAAALLVMRLRAIKQLADAAANDDSQTNPDPADAASDPEDMRRTMLAFESIGIDCEFGTIQRHFGAEPLGLLRWNDVTHEGLMAALAVSLEGLGHPDNTELRTGEVDEFYVRDKRWGLDMHTCLFAHEVSHVALYPKMCTRVSYLRDKFLSDLRDAKKIFVFKSEDDLERILRLHQALRRFGPVHLLNVRVTGLHGTAAEKAPGEIIAIAPDLHVGFVERTEDLTDIPYPSWTRILTAVLGQRGATEI